MRYGSIKRWAPLVSGDAATVRPPSRVRAFLFSLKRGKGICSHDHKGEEEERGSVVLSAITRPLHDPSTCSTETLSFLLLVAVDAFLFLPRKHQARITPTSRDFII